MDYKEKYKKALERARIWKNKSGMPKDKQSILDDIFSELKESEDERIRKVLIRLFRSNTNEKFYDISTQEIIDWLKSLKDRVGCEARCTTMWKPSEEDEKIRKMLIEFFGKGAKNNASTNGISDKDIISWLEKQNGQILANSTKTCKNEPVNIDIESMEKAYKQRLESQQGNFIKNSPLLNMCLSAYRHGVNNILEEVNLEKIKKKEELKSDEWKEGDVIRHGGILALIIKGRRAIKSDGKQLIIQYPDEWIKAEQKEREYFLEELEEQLLEKSRKLSQNESD